MADIKAILFDLDGTLRDSREVIYPAVQHALKVHTGREFTRDEIAPHVHHHTVVHKHLVGDAAAFQDFDTTYFEKVNELRSKMVLYKDAAKVLKLLHEAGYRLAVVSAASTAAQYLEEFGLADYFEVFVGGNDTKEHKPSPEPVLLALKRLSISPDQAVMVGDLVTDIRAAAAAGLFASIAISHGFGSRKQLQAEATYTIDSLAELPEVIVKIAAH